MAENNFTVKKEDLKASCLTIQSGSADIATVTADGEVTIDWTAAREAARLPREDGIVDNNAMIRSIARLMLAIHEETYKQKGVAGYLYWRSNQGVPVCTRLPVDTDEPVGMLYAHRFELSKDEMSLSLEVLSQRYPWRPTK